MCFTASRAQYSAENGEFIRLKIITLTLLILFFLIFNYLIKSLMSLNASFCGNCEF